MHSLLCNLNSVVVAFQGIGFFEESRQVVSQNALGSGLYQSPPLDKAQLQHLVRRQPR